MSQENVELFGEGVQAVNRGDIPAVLRGMDPEIRFEHRLAEMQGDYIGLDGVTAFFADFTEHFDSVQIHCPDIRDLGDRVLALGTIHATGKGSGVETKFTLAVLARYKDGLITHYIDFGQPSRSPRSRRAVGVVFWRWGAGSPSDRAAQRRR
jgi:hypothetical protein